MEKKDLINDLKEKIYELQVDKFNKLWKELNNICPNTLSICGGHEFYVSEIDNILFFAKNKEDQYIQEEEASYELLKEIAEIVEEGSDYEEYDDFDYEEYDDINYDDIDYGDIDYYKKVKNICEENEKLSDLVNDHLKEISNCDSNIEEKLKRLVRADRRYKNLSNKDKLSSCVVSVLKKNDILYSFDIENTIYNIFIDSCENEFDLVFDLLNELSKDIEDTLSKPVLYSTKYINKLNDIKYQIDKSIEFEEYKNDPGLKYALLNCVDLRMSSEIDLEYKIKKIKNEIKRKYESELRRYSKEDIRKKALELKSKGIRNNEIARLLGKSKGYISDLLNGVK